MKTELLNTDPNDTLLFLEGLKEPTASQLRRLEMGNAIELDDADGSFMPVDQLIDEVDVDGCVLARPGVIRSGLAKVAMSPDGQVWDSPAA